jgi:hypothetical protein
LISDNSIDPIRIITNLEQLDRLKDDIKIQIKTKDHPYFSEDNYALEETFGADSSITKYITEYKELGKKLLHTNTIGSSDLYTLRNFFQNSNLNSKKMSDIWNWDKISEIVTTTHKPSLQLAFDNITAQLIANQTIFDQEQARIAEEQRMQRQQEAERRAQRYLEDQQREERIRILERQTRELQDQNNGQERRNLEAIQNEIHTMENDNSIPVMEPEQQLIRDIKINQPRIDQVNPSRDPDGNRDNINFIIDQNKRLKQQHKEEEPILQNYMEQLSLEPLQRHKNTQNEINERFNKEKFNHVNKILKENIIQNESLNPSITHQEEFEINNPMDLNLEDKQLNTEKINRASENPSIIEKDEPIKLDENKSENPLQTPSKIQKSSKPSISSINIHYIWPPMTLLIGACSYFFFIRKNANSQSIDEKL